MGKEAQLGITGRKRRGERQSERERKKERKDENCISGGTETKERTQKDRQETGQEDEGGQIADERQTSVRQNIGKTVRWD